MFALGLLACAVLTAFSAQAEVVDDFKECKNFFYQYTEPGGMDQNAKTICQMYSQGQPRRGKTSFPMRSYYATLYSTEHRIPLYSAYIFDPECLSDSGRTDSWQVEPQISVGYSDRNMVRERDLRNLGLDEDVIKRSQAMSSDYSLTGYDRGHLNPSSFSCGDGRPATFTLTNAAPMVSCFNRGLWRNWEETLKSFLINQLSSDGGSAKAYIVTGTVPNANLRIPQKEDSEPYSVVFKKVFELPEETYEEPEETYEEPEETYEEPEEPEEIYGRVTVPSHFWTAVCYKHDTDDRWSFSFGYMAENRPEQSGIDLMSVSDLEIQLSTFYSQLSGTQQRVSIFADACFGDNNKLDMVKEKFKSKIHTSTAVQTTYNAVKRAIGSDSQSSEKKVKVKEMSAKLAFDSMDTYYTVTEDLKVSAGSACLITDLRPVVKKSVRDEESDAVECLLVQEKQKTAADGSPCSSVSESSSSCVCTSGGKTKPYCSSPCLYKGDLKSYRCYSGWKPIECSPRYSLVTVNGERCKDDHPCATYGYDYYWCNTVSGGWDYCSPPLWDSKAKKGSTAAATMPVPNMVQVICGATQMTKITGITVELLLNKSVK